MRTPAAVSRGRAPAWRRSRRAASHSAWASSGDRWAAGLRAVTVICAGVSGAHVCAVARSTDVVGSIAGVNGEGNDWAVALCNPLRSDPVGWLVCTKKAKERNGPLFYGVDLVALKLKLVLDNFELAVIAKPVVSDVPGNVRL
jgi:hypothetical protein